ncbi:anhydro-N-acetylmuramic acid kinase [Arthrobacter sp. MSA 4-2]|uniref:anhydro-N-acetylmuramic acid kinase n=1 Tax=Arthrobacter sp. MSA 4-2 TaxID=2794349 RepID=UPI0018E89240|nr:anhydro-N-acetylmuramic acid kinase [Arthrobacter sp. MSA 4-2]MBJ2119392.1 anhydro-N-acetylmuramic acid kinase [Arthrobacter sp. MSA 4-2]
MRVIGLSSGTSVDAIDVAAADFELDGTELRMTPLGHREIPYSEGLREEIQRAMPPAATTMEAVTRLDTFIGQEFAAAAQALLAETGGTADLVVSHGQTLFHWIEDGTGRGTLQLGQPAWIAQATGLPVLSDLRSNDIAAGGQGAPLVSLFDSLLLAGRGDAAAALNSAALNLGGIANATVIRPGQDPVAFDTGPANALLDAAVRAASGGRESVDRDGEGARAGTVDNDLLAALLAHPYYARPAPKSTGRELFHSGYLDAVTAARPCTTADLLATLTELTARTVADALAPFGVGKVFVSGGGTRNPFLLERLGAHLEPAQLRDATDLGIDADAKEAYLFALLGFFTWHGLPGTLASATGSTTPPLAGRITPGAGPLRLPEPAAVPPERITVSFPAPVRHP